MWGKLHKSVLVAGLLAMAATARGDAPAPAAGAFGNKTELANGAFSSIDARVKEIEGLRAQASREGQALKLSCIEEKLKRAGANLSAARVVMEGWALGENNPAYAQRQLDRLLLLQVYGTVYAEEAKSCRDAKTAAHSLEQKPPGPPGPPPDSGPHPTKPPHFERPPLASPF